MRGRIFALAALIAAACGGRTGLTSGPPKPPEPECASDADCMGDGDLCRPRECQLVEQPYDDGAGGSLFPTTVQVAMCVDLEAVDCDDNDPCTTDVCAPATGLCSYTPASLDLDGDGHRAPRPGFRPGEAGSCGDDCDDSNPAAFPGNPETCDGADNDCNGIVDDNASFIPLGGGDIRLSNPGFQPSGSGGLAFSGGSYAAIYTSSAPTGTQLFVTTIAKDGGIINPPGEQPVTFINGDAFGGPIVWIGDRYGVAWQDRRTGDYEIYFSILDAAGNKKHADTQVTFAPDFSVGVSLAWNQSEFILVWQDDRNGNHNLWGQRMSIDSVPIGGNVQLTTDKGTFGNEAPSVAAGLKTIGVVSGLGDALNHIIEFQAFSMDLAMTMSPPIALTDGSTDSVYPTVVWNNDRYIIAWFDRSAVPQSIWAAAVAEDGTILTPARPVTFPGSFKSRYPFLRALGDRVLLVYSDNRDQNQGYEIYSVMLTPTLDPLTPELRVTNAPHDSTNPIAAFGGAGGDVGILFRDHRDLTDEVYFTRLGCVSGP